MYFFQIQQYFSYIMAVSFIDGGNRRTRKNHRPVLSHLQALSHNVVPSTPRYERGLNSIKEILIMKPEKFTFLKHLVSMHIIWPH